MHLWFLVLLIAGCTEDRLEWYPVYPLPAETAVNAERSFAIFAHGAYTHPPCDEPARLPRAAVFDPSRNETIDVRITCDSPYLRLAPLRPLRAGGDYQLQITLDGADTWAGPVYSAPAEYAAARVELEFSTASRPTVISAHWSGALNLGGPPLYIAYVMVSQQLGSELAVELEVAGRRQPVAAYLKSEWFGACDTLSQHCQASYWGRQHIVVVYVPQHGPLIVTGTAADGTSFGPLRVIPE